MRILHIIFSLKIGGTETMLVDILNEQSAYASVELVIVNDHYDENLLKNIRPNVKVHLIRRKPSSINLFKLLQLQFIISRISADIIHCHNHNIFSLVKAIGGAKICLTVHDVKIATHNLFRYDRVFAISDAVKKDIVKRGKIDSKIVNNGVNFSMIKSKTEFCLSKKLKIVQVSRLDHNKKGQHLVLRALKLLIHEKGIQNIQYDIIGEGESLEYLIELTKQLNIERHVNFLGARNREFIYTQLMCYDLLVQPSLYEGFGLTVVEGMAAKIPVLVSNIDGPYQVIGKGKYGYSFKSNDYISCAEAIEKILFRMNNLQLKTQIEASYEYARNQFSIQHTASNYISEYKNLL